MGGMMGGGGGDAPAPDMTATNKQIERMDAQQAELDRSNASRRRLLAGRGGTGSRLLRFDATSSDEGAPSSSGGTAALLGG